MEGHQFLNPAARRRGAADPPPQRLQDLRARPCSAGEPTTTVRALLEGHGYDVHVVAGDEPDAGAPPTLAATLDAASARSARSRTRRGRGLRAARPAGRDRAAHAEGLDRAPTSSTACRSRAPSAPTRCRSPTCATNPEHLAAARGVDAQLPPGRALRRRTAGSCPSSRRSRPRRAADGRQPARQRRPLTRAARAARLRDYARRRRRRPAPTARVDAPARRAAARHLPRNDATTLPALLPRRDQLEPARRGVRGRDRCLVERDRSRSTITCRPTAA